MLLKLSRLLSDLNWWFSMLPLRYSLLRFRITMKIIDYKTTRRLKKFRYDVIQILFDDNKDLTDEEIYARLRILKRTYEDVLEGKKDMTHWALQNIS